LDLQWEDDAEGVRLVRLTGRMDLDGAAAIDLKLTSVVATDRTSVVIDLSGVDFVASMGLSTLVRCARAAWLRGGNVVLLNPQRLVRQLLGTTRIDQILPVFTDLADARTAALAPPSRNVS
jgi:anti-anti-sigma factor